MGGTTSTEFRIEACRLCTEDISPNDHERWKVLLLTHMQPNEVPMFLSPLEVRYMRRYKPNNLAALLYKCIEQLRFVADRAIDLEAMPTVEYQQQAAQKAEAAAGAGTQDKTYGKATRRKPSKQDLLDWCCARNAVRVIGAVLPYVFEPENKDVKLPETSESKLRARLAKSRGEEIKAPVPSVFGEDFVDHFLKRNSKCEGTDLHASPVFQDSSVLPLGQELMQLLVKLCFVPGFTIGWQQVVHPSELAQLSEEVLTRRRGAIPQLFWFGGILAESGCKFANTPQMRSDRCEVMRCILASCTRPLYDKTPSSILATNELLDILRDGEKCPLIPTLVASLLNCMVVHNSRGILPWTSHYFADDAEACLALCFQLSSVLLAEDESSLQFAAGSVATPSPERGQNNVRSGGVPMVGADAEESEATADAGGPALADPNAPLIQVEESTNAVKVFFNALFDEEGTLSLIAQGVLKVVENPCFAANTTIQGTQKIVHCYQEALILLVQLSTFPKFRQHLCTRCLQDPSKVLYPLLFFAQEARVDYAFFGTTQAAVMVLLALSCEKDFIRALNNPLPRAKTALSVLPPLPGANYGDVLVLMICSTISPSSPRYMSCFHESFGTVLCNVIPSFANLTETTCYELHHMLDFVTSEKFLRHGLNHERACALVTEALVTLVVHQPTACRTLIAALGVSSAPSRLLALIEQGAALPADTEGLSLESPAADAPRHVDPAADIGENEALPEGAAAVEVGKPKKPKKAFRFHPSIAPHHFARVLQAQAERSAATLNNTPAGGAVQEMATLELPAAMRTVERTIRQYDLQQRGTMSWLNSYLWGIIYKHNVNPPIFDANEVTAFSMK